MQRPGRTGAKQRKQLQQNTSAFQDIHSAGESEPPLPSGLSFVEQNRGVIIYIGPQRLDAITDRDNTTVRDTVPDVFRPHMLGICEHHVIVLDQSETTGLSAVKRNHLCGVQSAATPRIEVEETLPPKPALAGIGRGYFESFASADASPLIRVGEKHGWSNLQNLPLELKAGQVVAIDHIGTPLPYGRYGALNPQITGAPGRRPFRQPDGRSLGRLIDFMAERNIVTSLV